MARCERCGVTTTLLTMSRFNTQMICVARPDGQPTCEQREKAHPAYPAAAHAELDAVRRGEWNFPGVGKPDDL